jgi:hypothetical protein
LDLATVILQNKVISLVSDPLEDLVSVFISPSERVALYHQARGYISIAFNDSQGYGGSILTHLHMGIYK